MTDYELYGDSMRYAIERRAPHIVKHPEHCQVEMLINDLLADGITDVRDLDDLDQRIYSYTLGAAYDREETQ